MEGGEEAYYAQGCRPHGRWAGDSLRGLHQMEGGWVTLSGGYIRWKLPFIVVPPRASHKPTEHAGVRNVTIVSVKNATTRQNSIFRN